MDARLIMSVARGLASRVPVLNRLSARRTGGSVSARYCYSVWLRHLAISRRNGLREIPRVVAELGPGDSLGMGLAAVLSGADELRALDVVHYADLRRNLRVLDELLELLRRRETIPGDEEFPDVAPRLDSYAFPAHLLDAARLEAALAPARVAKIRAALEGAPPSETAPIRIAYHAPWTSADLVQRGTVDLVYSQAVLEHVNDLDLTYDALHQWLKPGGFMSHQIDFRSHGLTREWNGHWGLSDEVWAWIQGGKPFLLNRHAHSVHVRKLGEHGFELAGDVPVPGGPGIPRARLAPRFRDYSEEDLRTSGALLQAVRR